MHMILNMMFPMFTDGKNVPKVSYVPKIHSEFLTGQWIGEHFFAGGGVGRRETCWICIDGHGLSSSCSKQGLLSSCSTWASHCGGFSSCGAWAPGCKDSAAALHSLVAPWHVASSSTRDQPHVPCTSRWVLKHRVTREIQGEELLSYISNNTGRTPEFLNSILNF